ncbi:MAG: M20/M25/M40 family metallo-hydrolase [Chloroflexi bacterium]|nr:M20/M25/M40 family metallo-hydrolase [Chloroflexota bacterium]
MINQDRLKEHLLGLLATDSVSRHEKAIAEKLRRDLEALGAAVEMDDAGERVKGDSGNLIARLSGVVASAPPLLLEAHMDTVVPGEGVKPIVQGHIVRSDGSTVLGGDDKTGVAAIVEAVRALKESGAPHGDLEVVFTICEEVGLLGAKHLDVSRLRSKMGLILDSDEVTHLYIKAPSAEAYRFKIHGLAAHAGIWPERGISAIRIASEAIAAMKLGRIDEETTANVGTISGGAARNIVPQYVEMRGEARSHSEAKLEEQRRHMMRCFEEAAARHRVVVEGAEHAGRVETVVERDYERMDVPEDAPIVLLTKQAGTDVGLEIETKATGGGSDANVFNRKGIVSVILGTGMRDVHTVNEWLDVREVTKAAAVVLGVIRLAAAK